MTARHLNAVLAFDTRALRTHARSFTRFADMTHRHHADFDTRCARALLPTRVDRVTRRRSADFDARGASASAPVSIDAPATNASVHPVTCAH